MKRISLNFFLKPEASIEKRFQTLKEYDKQKMAGYLYIILTLFSVSFLGLFAINPTLSTISNLKRQYEDDTFIESSLTKKIIALNQLSEQYKQIAPNLEVTELAIPRSNKIPDFTSKILYLAKQHNITIKKFDIGGIELYPGNQVSEGTSDKKSEENEFFTISLSVEGKGQEVNTFLLDIINIDRLITLDLIDLRKEQEDTASLTLGGKVYFDKKR